MRFGGPDQSGGQEWVFGAWRVIGFAVLLARRAWTAGFAHCGGGERASLSSLIRRRAAGLVTEPGKGRATEVPAAGGPGTSLILRARGVTMRGGCATQACLGVACGAACGSGALPLCLAAFTPGYFRPEEAPGLFSDRGRIRFRVKKERPDAR
jgi:hypothetical protein